MKVLWVTNTIFPDLAHELGMETPVVGGWMYGLANDLAANGIELVVATTKPKMVAQYSKIRGIEYYILCGKTNIFYHDSSLENAWKEVVEKTLPDVVHIHGTEYAHGLSLISACPELSYVLSIQGLISACAKYYDSGISKEEIIKNITFKDLIKSSSILQTKKEFKRRGELTEKEYFKNVKNVIGRTTWDYAHTQSYDSDINYFFCNESLRNSFYTSRKWNSSNKKNHSIFLSQAGYPLKGFHQVIKAVALLKDEFPNIKIRVAGNDILKTETFKDKLKLDGYGKYLINLLKDNNLLKNIEFIGFLNEEEMLAEYLNCHVFVCPSSIENSPNSLGEAQLLGTPCIASYVGGVPDMIENEQTGLLYRFEEIEILAQHITTIFTNFELTRRISLGGIKAAAERHDRKENLSRILEIYKEVNIIKKN